jgi:hypothetical protein
MSPRAALRVRELALRCRRAKHAESIAWVDIRAAAHEWVVRIHGHTLSTEREVRRILLGLRCTVCQLHRIEQRHQLLISVVDFLLGSGSCVDSLATAHVVAKDLDLRFEGAPEVILVEWVVFLVVIEHIGTIAAVVRIPGQVEQSRNESFLQVSEAEVLGDLCDGVAELDGEVDALLVLELLLPVLRCILLAWFSR